MKTKWLALIFFLFCFEQAQSAGKWQELAGSAWCRGVSRSPGASQNCQVAFMPDGRIVVAWEQKIGANWEIHLRRWNGKTPVGRRLQALPVDGVFLERDLL